MLEGFELGAAGHHLGQLALRDALLGEVAHRVPPIENHEPVAHRVGVVRVVGDEDHRQPPVACLHDAPKHHARLLHAQRRGGLVQDQHPGAEVAGPRNCHRLPLAARQRAHRLLGVADVDAHLGQLLLGDLLGLLDVDPAERAEALGGLGAEEEIAPHRHERHHGEVLIDGGDALRQRLARGREPDRLAADQQFARVVLMHPGQDLDERRLAGAVVAQHTGHLAGVDRGGNPGESDDVAVVLRDAPQLDERVRVGCAVACAARGAAGFAVGWLAGVAAHDASAVAAASPDAAGSAGTSGPPSGGSSSGSSRWLWDRSARWRT